MVYFPIYYMCNVISWNKIEQKTVRGYYSADLIILKENNTHKYKLLVEKVQKT